jgi:gliding motility-associated-like protein
MRIDTLRHFLLLLIFLSSSFGLTATNRDSLLGNHISFIENKGQWDQKVLFKTELNGGSIYIERGSFTFDLRDQEAFSKFVGYKLLPREIRVSQKPPDGLISHFAYHVRFEGSDPDAACEGIDPQPGIYNYFLGNDPAKWASKVKRYDQVRFTDYYPGIDMLLLRDESLFKYEFQCSPGSKPESVKMIYDGVKDIKIRYGNLMITTPFGVIYELKPVAWQIVDGVKRDVSCRFRLNGQQLSFDLGKYNPDVSLIIDPPVRVFASYTGSTADNWGYTATYDDLGNLYDGGNVFGNGYPVTTGAYQTNYAGHSSDIAIAKFHSNGAYLEYATYLGGSGTEVPHSLIVNSLGQLYILGSSGSSNFPTTSGAYDQTFNGGSSYTLTSILTYSSGSDIVISKLSADGTQLLASTYIGGSARDGLNTASVLKHNYADEVRGEIILDQAGNVLVVSSTESSDFPVTTGALQTSKSGTQDAVIFKMDNQLTSLIWSTYLGGSGTDAGYSIVSDPVHGTYVAGGTTSTNFPVTGGVVYGSSQGGSCDGWIAKLAPNGNQLLHSTYFGSSAYDQVYFVDLDKQGNVYVFGQTGITGNYFVTNAAWFKSSGGQFVTKLTPVLSSRVWSTTFGSGSGIDISPTAFMVDLCNRIYLSGWGGNVNGFGGTSGLPVTADAFQSTTDNSDYYFMVIKDDASGLVYATYYGGSQSAEHVDGGTSRFDSKGRIYQTVCAGCGGHSDFPTSAGAWSNTNNSNNCNNGVVVFNFVTPALVADFIDPPSICAPDTIFFVNTSQVPSPSTTTYHWDFGNGNTSTLPNPYQLYTASGVYTVTLILSDMGSCNFADTITKQVVVLSGQSSSIASKNICKGDQIQIGILPINDPGVTYHWIPSSWLNNPFISNPVCNAPSNMNYKLLVSNGICTDTISQQVIVHSLAVDAGPDVGICKGSVLLTAISSNTGVSYQWSDNSSFTTTLNPSPSTPSCTVTITVPQYFYVKLYNAWCSAIDSVYVDQLVKFSVVSTLDPKCAGVCDGQASVSLVGGTPPYTYSWSGSSSATGTANDLCAGNQSVTVTDINGCFGVSQFTLTDPPPLIAQATSLNTPCKEVCVGKGYANPSGGTPPYTYLWNDPSAQQTNPAINLCPGSFMVTVTDSKGCKDTSSIIVEDSSIYITLKVSVAKDTVFEGQEVQLLATWLGNNYTYQWVPSTWLNNPNIFNPIASPYASVTYTVIVKDKYGCTFTDSLEITVLEVFCEEPFIFVPNAFTPNSDGMNDILYLYTIYAEDIYFAIFDRLGEKVFETRNKDHGWDGTYKGRDVDPGVFDYYLEVHCFNKIMFKKKGNITLIR